MSHMRQDVQEGPIPATTYSHTRSKEVGMSGLSQIVHDQGISPETH